MIAYDQAKAAGKSEEEAIRILNEQSRDHSRNTMYWNGSAYGGFSDHAPWINYQKQPGKSAAEQVEDKDSLFSYVSELVYIRTEEEILANGSCTVESPCGGVIVLTRSYNGKKLRAVINFSENEYEDRKSAVQEEAGNDGRSMCQKEELLILSRPDALTETEDTRIISARSSAVWRYSDEC